MNWSEYRGGLRENGSEPIELTVRIFDKVIKVQKVFSIENHMGDPRWEARGLIDGAISLRQANTDRAVFMPNK